MVIDLFGLQVGDLEDNLVERESFSFFWSLVGNLSRQMTEIGEEKGHDEDDLEVSKDEDEDEEG